jgi:hypothetical protein
VYDATPVVAHAGVQQARYYLPTTQISGQGCLLALLSVLPTCLGIVGNNNKAQKNQREPRLASVCGTALYLKLVLLPP